ncbi:MAG: hypothetical protein ACKVOH_02700 [Chlamydiales bacterium]
MFKQAYRFDDQTGFYFDAYDNKHVAKGGSLAWRLNNPGLLHAHEPFIKKFNRIGAHALFVIFPKVAYYLVGFETLLSKSEAISWVDEHRLDAVIVHKKNGTIYLRSRPGHHLNQIHLTNDEYGEETEFENAIRDIGNKKNGQCIWGYINGVWNTDKGAASTTKLISEFTEDEQVWS